MQYRRDRQDRALSVLGYGCLRFPKKAGRIDLDAAEEQILAAIEGGVNYFDTAYVYNGSEAALGEILARTHMRDKVFLATKLPHYLIRSVEGAERLFQEELRRLRTDHVDVYLMHMLADPGTWASLQALGIDRWLLEKKKSGAIRSVGFSYHGNSETFCKLVDAWDWDICQIQYNYMDENSQAGRAGLRHANAKGLPVVIMEPLRGGRLVNLLPQSAKQRIAAHPSGRSAAEWALRWLWDQPEVTCVLSGMNSLPMVRENLRIADAALPGCMTPDDQAFLDEVKAEIEKNVRVGCTGCGYCMPCPHGVDIPGTFRCYNAIYGESRKGAQGDYLRCTAMRKTPGSASQCVGCGKCEQHCPQKIAIRQELKNAARELETPLYKIERWGIQLLKLWK